MTVKILKNVIPADKIAEITELLKDAPWENGKDTAHGTAKDVKNNLQLNKPSPQLAMIQKLLITSLANSPAFEKYAMPVRMSPIFVNRCENGGHYGRHVDRGYKIMKPSRLRGDLSTTIFLSDGYEGGELVVYDGDSSIKVKGNPGDIVLYPANFIHEVLPVTSGVRTCACFWTQSMVRDPDKRSIITRSSDLCNMLAKQGADREAQLIASEIQQNLIRQWAET